MQMETGAASVEAPALRLFYQLSPLSNAFHWKSAYRAGRRIAMRAVRSRFFYQGSASPGVAQARRGVFPLRADLHAQAARVGGRVAIGEADGLAREHAARGPGAGAGVEEIILARFARAEGARGEEMRREARLRQQQMPQSEARRPALRLHLFRLGERLAAVHRPERALGVAFDDARLEGGRDKG